MADSQIEGVGAELPSREDALGWIGYRVDEMGGSSVARVLGVFLDTESGEPVWVIAKLGRFGKVVAIPFLDCAAAAGHLWIPYTRDVLRSAPVVDPSKPLTREQELAICAHYGVHEEIGRAKEVSACEEGAVTAQVAGAA
jgi:hypothetical protein